MESFIASEQAASTERTTMVFSLGTQQYGLDLALVQELRGYGAIAPLSDAPDYLKGVLNLQGVVVPVVDLRMKFGQPAPAYESSTVVVVLKLNDRMIGIVVDRVVAIIALSSQQLPPAPRSRRGGCADHVLTIATVDERIQLVVDMTRWLSDFNEGFAGAVLLAA